MKKLLILPVITALLISGCKKDDDETPTPTPTVQDKYLTFNFTYNVDGSVLSFNNIQYVNDAGNQYSVTKLNYYLSQIALVTDSDTYVMLKDYLYINATASPALKINLNSIPKGTYKGLSLNIGLDSAQNITGGLPVTAENLAMEWPVMMGGGYHFMMLEGKFIDSAGTPGYAMHLGTNMALSPVYIQTPVVVTSDDKNINLSMNINEWYRNPSLYDFNVDGNYIMGDAQAMAKIAANGYDVFTIQ